MISGISAFVYREFLRFYPANGIRKLYTTLFFYIRNVLVRLFNDPVIYFDLGKRKIYMNLSYNLPIILRNRPYYNSCLPRLGDYVNKKDGSLVFIDVGANLGDTIALVSDRVDGRFLCVEPSDMYFEILKKNEKILNGIVAEKKYCDEVQGPKSGISLKHQGDSALLVDAGKDEKPIEATTIDELIEIHSEFKTTNVFKIDTDGYDAKVFRGAVNLLKQAKPVLFFEYEPNYMKKTGEKTDKLFEFLRDHGYSEYLFYDKYGYPVMKVNFKDVEIIRQLTEYTYMDTTAYYDILAFPDSRSRDFTEYHQMECDFFKRNAPPK